MPPTVVSGFISTALTNVYIASDIDFPYILNLKMAHFSLWTSYCFILFATNPVLVGVNFQIY